MIKRLLDPGSIPHPDIKDIEVSEAKVLKKNV